MWLGVLGNVSLASGLDNWPSNVEEKEKEMYWHQSTDGETMQTIQSYHLLSISQIHNMQMFDHDDTSVQFN